MQALKKSRDYIFSNSRLDGTGFEAVCVFRREENKWIIIRTERHIRAKAQRPHRPIHTHVYVYIHTYHQLNNWDLG